MRHSSPSRTENCSESTLLPSGVRSAVTSIVALANPAETRLSMTARPPGLPLSSNAEFTKSKYGRLSFALPSGSSTGSGCVTGSGFAEDDGEGDAGAVSEGGLSGGAPVQATSVAAPNTTSAPTAQQRMAPMSP